MRRRLRESGPKQADTLKLFWSERALADLDAIVRYIAQDNKQAAHSLRDRIESSVLTALEHPYAFRRGRTEGTREIIANPNYVVIYQVRSESLVVSAIIHARQKYP